MLGCRVPPGKTERPKKTNKRGLSPIYYLFITYLLWSPIYVDLDILSFICDSCFVKYEIKTTNIFDKWLMGLKDKTVVNRIMTRLYRIEQGNLGDVKTVVVLLWVMINLHRERTLKKLKKSWGENNDCYNKQMGCKQIS